MSQPSPITARCDACANGLDFESWASGAARCRRCAAESGSTIDYVVGPGPAEVPRAPVDDEAWVGDLPPEMFDQIAEELLRTERETAARQPSASVLRQLLAELDLSASAKETRWASWGFAAGFAGNAAVAKYAQMTTDASMSDFIAPMVLGGLVAGATAGVIGWGAARLREA